MLFLSITHFHSLPAVDCSSFFHLKSSSLTDLLNTFIEARPQRSLTKITRSLLSIAKKAHFPTTAFTMHRMFSFIIVAFMAATLALAAPVTPAKALLKRSFKVPSKGRPKLSPAAELARVYNKHGWEVIIFNPNQPYGGFFSSSSAAPVPYSTAPPPGGYFSSSYVVPPPSSTAPPASVSSRAVSSNVGSYSDWSSSNSARPTSSGGSPADGSEEGEVTATPEENESQYLAPVKIGGQSLNINLDTGSADLWVYSNRLSSQVTSGHSIFDPSRSSTWSNYPGGSWDIEYGDGSTARGSVGFDTVNVGGAVVEKQCIELAEEVSGSFQTDINSDGLLGLGFSVVNTVQPQPQKTFFENVMDDLDQPVFTADLEENNSGTYEFGSIDTSKYTGDIHYTPIDPSNGYWQFDSGTFNVGGKQQRCQTCSPAIADTGTSLIIVDDDVAEAYYSQVQGSSYSPSNGVYLYPCSSTLPDFGVAIGNGYTATLKGSDTTYMQDGSQCLGGIAPNGASSGSGAPIQIYGDVLLKHFFAVFDGGSRRFGLANKA